VSTLRRAIQDGSRYGTSNGLMSVVSLPYSRHRLWELWTECAGPSVPRIHRVLGVAAIGGLATTGGAAAMGGLTTTGGAAAIGGLAGLV
jgi:hypothetical protein